MFFTSYLYRRAFKHRPPVVHIFGEPQHNHMHNFFLYFLRADVASPYLTAGISNTLQSAIELLPPSKHLQKVLKDYLLYGSYNEGWGNILLSIALSKKFLSPE